MSLFCLCVVGVVVFGLPVGVMSVFACCVNVGLFIMCFCLLIC